MRWLGRVGYAEALDLQTQLFSGDADHLLLLEHPPVYTTGLRAKPEHLLSDPAMLGAELHRANRGGDVTFHGPGQLVCYPILNVTGHRGGGMADTRAYVASVEQVIIEVLADLGLTGQRIENEPGVWIDGNNPRKIAAIGTRLSRGRSMHGFALNVATDMDWFKHIVPCGITDKGVTSLRAEGLDTTLADVVDLVVKHASRILTPNKVVDRRDVVWRQSPSDLSAFSRGEGPGNPIKSRSARDIGSKTEDVTDSDNTDAASLGVPVRLLSRLAAAGVVGGEDLSARKPEWMRVKLKTDQKFMELRKVSRKLDLTTVCEEAGCPNIFECWNEGTATYMLLGERCTRACGFCLVDTSKPLPVDPDEPDRIAEAVRVLGLDFVVLTMVARDDLEDGGAHIVARTIGAIRRGSSAVGIEVLISDLNGSRANLQTIIDAAPTVLNHNVETVPRLQRAVRPSAGYARSLTVLSRAKLAGLTTKSGLVVGMGETFDEVVSTLADLAAIDIDIVTIGQYLRPTTHHLPVHDWWSPDQFAELKLLGEQTFGIPHIESSPLTRSSHHAGQAVAQLATPRPEPDLCSNQPE